MRQHHHRPTVPLLFDPLRISTLLEVQVAQGRWLEVGRNGVVRCEGWFIDDGGGGSLRP